MAATVSGASLSAIYDRVNGVAPYNPMTADTFADWSVESGDYVTISRGTDEYNVPVHSSKLVWKGAPKLSLSATGTQHRPAVSKVSKQKYRRGSAALRSEEGIYREFHSEDGALHSYVSVTAEGIMTEVSSGQSELAYSIIQQTSTQIKMEVADTVSGIAHSVIEQTATYIHMEVSNAASSISQTVIEQTAEYVRTEVASVASGVAWSVVEQTMTNITQQISRKSTVYVQWLDPAGMFSVNDGDIWIKSKTAKTWNQVGGQTWDSVNQDTWRDYYGCQQYVRRNGAWELVSDKGAVVENTVKIETTANSYAIVGREIDTLKQEVRSNLTVTASKINADVSTASSKIYSTIEQTATNIRSMVVDKINQTESMIEQTASQIHAQVVDAKNELQSSITQTASEIRAEVSTANTSIWSSITQTSTQISLKVGKGEVISSINQTAESITINASKVNLDGYVLATDLTTNWLSAKIAGIDSVGVKNLAASGSISIKEGNTYYAIARSIQDLNLSLSGNTYTLQYKKWDDTQWQTVGTFSRATSLSAGWDGSRKFTVSASPQGNSRYTTIRSSVPNSKASWSSGVGTLTLEATIDDSETFSDIGTVTVNAPSDQGNNAGNVSLGSAESTTTRPSGTSLSSWRNTIVNAINNRQYFRFRATLSGGSGTKWYYIDFE